MLFKQTMNPPNCKACFAENMFKISTDFLLQYTSADQTTSTRQQSTAGKRSRFFTHRKPRDSAVCLNGTTILFIFFLQQMKPPPDPRLVKPVSGQSPSPAGWPSPQTWWSSTVIRTGWWSAWLCCSGWWGWRGARGPQGPEGGSCHTSRPACSDLAAPKRERTRTVWKEKKNNTQGDRIMIQISIIDFWETNCYISSLKTQWLLKYVHYTAIYV